MCLICSEMRIVKGNLESQNRNFENEICLKNEQISNLKQQKRQREEKYEDLKQYAQTVCSFLLEINEMFV